MRVDGGMSYAARLAMSLFILAGCRPVEPAVDPGGAAAWKQLVAGLPGRWRATYDGHAIDVEYRLTSRGTVVVETWMPDTPAETVTTYHLDGDALMLTHYCGLGNQPRLRLTALGSHMQFARFDATDLQPEEPVLTDLTLEVGPTSLKRTETYVRGEDRETTELVFTRMQ